MLTALQSLKHLIDKGSGNESEILMLMLDKSTYLEKLA